MLFPIANKEIAPNDAGDGYNEPIQGAKVKALDRVPIFVGAKAADLSRIWDTEENEDSQRQTSAITRQKGDNTVAEPLAGEL